MNLIYLQCDNRFNHWMLEEINGMCVIDHTIKRCKQINEGKCKIVSGVYNCKENTNLVKKLSENNVNVIITDEENVNRRFLDIVSLEKDDGYVIRVGGDQCLLDADKVSDIIEEMNNESKKWYYENYSSCILPDIISINYLKENKTILQKRNRYFEALEETENIERYVFPYPILILFNFRANSNESFRICKYIIENNLDIYNLSKRLSLQLIRSSYLNQRGILGSWILPSEYSDFFYDEDKNINPWWGISVIDLVKKYLNKSMRVFEWGSGNSTLFWSQHVKEVVSVEHNREWFEKMLNIVPANVKLNYCDLEYGGEYCEFILGENENFDIVLVDGRDRVRCIMNAVKRLKNNGILILDNSEREGYKPGKNFLEEQGFKKIEISSVIYGLPGIEDFTAIYYKKNNLMDW